MTTAWALLAVSSDGQDHTLPHQRAWAKETATERGWHLEREFAGVSSGRDDARKLVRDMLTELKNAAAPPAWLMMTRLDRLGRNALECQIVLRDIHACGVKVWTRAGGEEKGDTAMERLVSTVKLFVAEQDNEDKRDKLLAVYKRKRAAGLAVGNKRPYGLAIGPDGRDEPVEDQAAAVRTMFEMRAQGIGLQRIANHMAAVAPPQRYKRSGEYPMRWNKTLVRTLLANRAFIGTVVDDVTFRRVKQTNADLAKFDGKAGHPWRLSGAIRCYCGWAMVGHASGKGASYRYYSCRALWNHDGKARHIRAERLEDMFVAFLGELGANEDLIAATRRANLTPSSPAVMQRALRTVRAEIAACTKRLERVWEIAELGEMKPVDVQPRLDAINEERAELHLRLADLEAQLVFAAMARRQTADVVAVIAAAAETYLDSLPEIQQGLARAVAAALGGLCVEQDGSISGRRAVDVNSRYKAPSAKSR